MADKPVEPPADPNEGRRAPAPETVDQTKAAYETGTRPGIDDEAQLQKREVVHTEDVKAAPKKKK